jgi:hypothetical protein
MRSLNLLSNINNRVNSSDSLFSIDINKQRAYLNHFREPKDLIERSYFQFKCQKFLENCFISIVKDIFAFLGFLPFLIFLFLKTKSKSCKARETNLGVVIFAGVSGIVPNDLSSEFDEITSVDFGKNYFLNKSDFFFVIKIICLYYFAPYFLIKSVFKIAHYRSIINEHNPKSIICSSEYSFTSSLLTQYCEKNDIMHINVMHGDKLYYIRDSFFQFHRCYVWDQHYIQLFELLRAEPNQFRISVPSSLKMEIPNNDFIYEFTYYLGGEPVDELQRISETLKKLPVLTHKICIRLHPRYFDLKQAYSIFSEFQIELPSDVSIEKSFSLTKHIVSLYSTVLYQGLMIGKEIVIDDVSSKAKYEKLLELQYILVSKPHKKLSSFYVQ